MFLGLSSILFCFLRQGFIYSKLSSNLIYRWGPWLSLTQCWDYRCTHYVRLVPLWESKQVSCMLGKLSTNRAWSPALGLGFGYKLYPVKGLSWTLKRMFQRYLRVPHLAMSEQIYLKVPQTWLSVCDELVWFECLTVNFCFLLKAVSNYWKTINLWKTRDDLSYTYSVSAWRCQLWWRVYWVFSEAGSPGTTFLHMAERTIASSENPVKTFWLWKLGMKQFLLVSRPCSPPSWTPCPPYLGSHGQLMSQSASVVHPLHPTWYCCMIYLLTLREFCCGAGVSIYSWVWHWGRYYNLKICLLWRGFCFLFLKHPFFIGSTI